MVNNQKRHSVVVFQSCFPCRMDFLQMSGIFCSILAKLPFLCQILFFSFYRLHGSSYNSFCEIVWFEVPKSCAGYTKQTETWRTMFQNLIIQKFLNVINIGFWFCSSLNLIFLNNCLNQFFQHGFTQQSSSHWHFFWKEAPISFLAAETWPAENIRMAASKAEHSFQTRDGSKPAAWLLNRVLNRALLP